MDRYVILSGKEIPQTQLSLVWAIDLVRYATSEISSFAKLIECRIDEDGNETIILDVEVEVGQYVVHDIKRTERIAVKFNDDCSIPDILALRDDFPQVPHLNFRMTEKPKSLCLFAERHEDIKRYWTPAFLISRVREWLKLTARGQLHKDDQPLEPLFEAVGCQIIIPFDLFLKDKQDARKLNVHIKDCQHNMLTLKATYAEPTTQINNEYIPVIIEAEAQEHGIIRRLPRNLNELGLILAGANIDLIGQVSTDLKGILMGNQYNRYKNSQLLLIVCLPKKRSQESKPEDIEIWAFIMPEPVSSVGEKLGLWEIKNGIPGILVAASEAIREIEIQPAKVVFSFNRELAAKLNGISKSDSRKIALVGAGALGSQIFMNLVRAGFGSWTLIDNDCLLPHNIARHVLAGYAVGYPKAYALSEFANTLFQSEKISDYIITDLLRPEKNEERINSTLKVADVIIDISTSISVERYISRDIESKGRRTSVFLNPSGTDSVLLVEDVKRTVTLDMVEMQYYRVLLYDEKLYSHIAIEGESVRYANSCRDVTSLMPQDLICIHAGVLSRALRNSLEEEQGCIAIWRVDPDDLTVEKTQYSLSETFCKQYNDWTIINDDYFERKIQILRAKKLPNETGGVLVGAFDMVRKLIYLVDTIASPSDSVEWPTSYIRGCKGLNDEVVKIMKITGNGLGYVGEWHSHPDGCAILPSTDDKKAFEWLSEKMSLEGRPAVMMIVGQDDYRVYVGTMSIASKQYGIVSD